MAELVPAAEEFAATLTAVVNGTVSSGIQFVVTPFEETELAWVFPAGSTPTSSRLIPVTAGLDPGQVPKLWLKASFQVGLDSSGDHLAVHQSGFSLVIDENTGRPVIRIEYDRDRGNEPDERPGQHRRSAAHVQIHGASEELAYVQGLNGETSIRGLDKFHIPVGGRRFRPSLEDFIEFLWAERLIRGLHDGWRDVLAIHRSALLARQVASGCAKRPGNSDGPTRGHGVFSRAAASCLIRAAGMPRT